MAIGKADHETITYIEVGIGDYRYMHIVFHWSELAIWGHYSYIVR